MVKLALIIPNTATTKVIQSKSATKTFINRTRQAIKSTTEKPNKNLYIYFSSKRNLKLIYINPLSFTITLLIKNTHLDPDPKTLVAQIPSTLGRHSPR